MEDEVGARPFSAIRVDLLDLVSFVIVFGLPVLQAGLRLGADAESALALLDENYVGPDADGCAEDFWEVLLALVAFFKLL